MSHYNQEFIIFDYLWNNQASSYPLTLILALRTAFSSEFYFSIHKTLFYSLPTEAGRED